MYVLPLAGLVTLNENASLILEFPAWQTDPWQNSLQRHVNNQVVSHRLTNRMAIASHVYPIHCNQLHNNREIINLRVIWYDNLRAANKDNNKLNKENHAKIIFQFGLGSCSFFPWTIGPSTLCPSDKNLFTALHVIKMFSETKERNSYMLIYIVIFPIGRFRTALHDLNALFLLFTFKHLLGNSFHDLCNFLWILSQMIWSWIIKTKLLCATEHAFSYV